jgi:hypothetical protein
MLLLLGAIWLGAGKVGLVYVGVAILSLAALVSMVLAYRIGGVLGDRRLALCAPIVLAASPYYVLMSFHGFETALVVMMTLATVLACLRNRPAWVIGVCLGFVTLARIDAGILALPVAAFLLVNRRWRDTMTVAGVSLIVTMPWIIWSWSNFGSPVPLSGVVKSDGFTPALIGPGAANFTRAFLFQTFGEGLSSLASWLVTFLAGLAMLIWLGYRRRRVDWIVGYVIVAIVLYSVLSTPHLVKQNQRYLAPAIVLTAILFFTSGFRRSYLVPLALAALFGVAELHSHLYSTRDSSAPNFVLLGKTDVPQVLDRIVAEDDLVGCFDSGSIAYFANVPVVNLDGLVNAEVVERLANQGGASPAEVYSRYLREKGITIIVGGSFYWPNYFPDLETWEVLAEPIPYTRPDGEVVFLRVPRSP